MFYLLELGQKFLSKMCEFWKYSVNIHRLSFVSLTQWPLKIWGRGKIIFAWKMAQWKLEILLLLKSVRKRKTNTIWYHLHVESNIWHKITYLWNTNRFREIENRLVVAKGEGRGRDGLRVWDQQMHICVCVCVCVYVCVCVWLSHFAVQQILTLHCKYTLIN